MEGLRSLTLIRHGAAVGETPGKRSDFDRALSPRGIEEARWVGRTLVSAADHFDRLISSPALRARQTATCVAEAIGFSEECIDWDDELYLADPQDLLDCLDISSASVHHVGVVGHNPGLSQFGSYLSQKNDVFLPTCGVARFELKLDGWETLGPGCVRRFEFQHPGPAGESG